MRTRVKMNIEMLIEHDENKSLEEVQGAAYWFIQPFLEQFTGENSLGEIANGCNLRTFNIDMED